MTRLRQLWMLTAVVSLAVLAGGYFLLVSPKANDAATIRADVETQLAANTKLTSQIAMLNKQKKDLPKLQAELEKFATRIPNNPGLPALVRSLSDAAERAGVELVGVSPSAPVLAPAAAPVAASAGTVSAAAAPASGLSLAHIPVSIQVAGSYSQISQFFSEVEGLPRAFLVTNVSVAPDKAAPTGGSATVDRGRLTAALNGRLFMTTTVAAPAPVKPVADETK